MIEIEKKSGAGKMKKSTTHEVKKREKTDESNEKKTLQKMFVLPKCRR